MGALSTRIRKARTQAKLSQAELARRIGVKRSAVTQWEHPRGTTPSVEHLIQIALHTASHFEWLATARGPSSSAEAAPATVVDDYARDEQESLMLSHVRCMSATRRKLALEILGLLAR